MSIIKRIFPILIFLGFILFLTLQSPKDTLSLSGDIQDNLLQMLPKVSCRWISDMHLFRTLLHIPLYFVLGVIVGICVSDFGVSVIICSLVSMSDEILKFFLPTREFEIIDLLFDVIGFFIGICFVILFRKIRLKI